MDWGKFFIVQSPRKESEEILDGSKPAGQVQGCAPSSTWKSALVGGEVGPQDQAPAKAVDAVPIRRPKPNKIFQNLEPKVRLVELPFDVPNTEAHRRDCALRSNNETVQAATKRTN